MKLFVNALTKYLVGLLLVCALVFLPAGTLGYFGGWLFISLLFLPMLILGVVLFIKSPALLEKRLNAKEKQKAQKGVTVGAGLMFISGFVVAGLDFRFGWSNVPFGVVIVAAVVLLVSYGLYAEVMRENEFLSRTIEVQDGQHVVDSGLYGVVRHPMYAVTLLLFFSIPIVLGSWWSVLCFLPYVVAIAVRIVDEEKLLERELDGYVEYKARVKYRLIPFIW